MNVDGIYFKNFDTLQVYGYKYIGAISLEDRMEFFTLNRTLKLKNEKIEEYQDVFHKIQLNYETEEDAMEAYKQLNGKLYQGQVFRLKPIISPRSSVISIDNYTNKRESSLIITELEHQYDVDIYAIRKDNNGCTTLYLHSKEQSDRLAEEMAKNNPGLKWNNELMVTLNNVRDINRTSSYIGSMIASPEAESFMTTNYSIMHNATEQFNKVLLCNIPNGIAEQELQEKLNLLIPTQKIKFNYFKSVFRGTAYVTFHTNEQAILATSLYSGLIFNNQTLQCYPAFPLKATKSMHTSVLE